MPGEEKTLQNQIIDWLNKDYRIDLAWQKDSFGYKGRRYHNRFRPAGFPDVQFIIKGGLSGFIEVKSKNQTMSEDQESFIFNRRLAGCVAFMADSFEDFKNKFEEEMKCKKLISLLKKTSPK